MFLKTNRLQLRALRPEDAAAIHAYRNNPDCARYQRWEATSPTEISRFVEKFRSCIFLSEQEEQHYAVCLSPDIFVGNLSYFFNAADNCITLGITVAPEYQRKGIAREILSAVMEATQSRYPRMDLVALIDPENEASIRLFKSLGFYRECYAESIASYVYVIDGIQENPIP